MYSDKSGIMRRPNLALYTLHNDIAIWRDFNDVSARALCENLFNALFYLMYMYMCLLMMILILGCKKRWVAVVGRQLRVS